MSLQFLATASVDSRGGSLYDGTVATGAGETLRRRITRGVIWAACGIFLLAGLIWLAATRWYGVPADPSGANGAAVSPVPIDPARDRTQELLSALADLPPDAPISLPVPPAGHRWTNGATSVKLSDALSEVGRGSWSPRERPIFQIFIAQFESPEVQAVLARLAAIAPGGYRTVSRVSPSLRLAAKLLTARARYRQTILNDIDAALDDLEAAYRLASLAYDSGNSLDSMMAGGFEGLAHWELRSLAYEMQLSGRQAARIIAAIRNTLPEQQALWDQLVLTEVSGLKRGLDLTFTGDGKENGWLVLSRLDGMVLAPRFAPAPRSGAWNLLSPLFNDRRTVAAKIEMERAILENAGRLSYGDALCYLRNAEQNIPFNLLDGPIGQVSLMRLIVSRHQSLASVVAERRAAIVDAALSAYRTDHAEYPSSLTELVDTYLEAIPLDPYDGQLLRYLRQGDSDYLLYSVGRNQIDDGGTPPRGRAIGEQSEPDGDRIFRHTRPEQTYDPKLEEVKQ